MDDDMKGYDIAGEDDFLDRKRLAQHIFNIIQNTNADWSVRIGIFGVWGAGKSTVLDYVLGYAADQQYPIIRLHPWTAKNLDELKQQLHNEILGNEQIAQLRESAKTKVKKLKKNPRSLMSRGSIFNKASKLEAPKNLVELISKMAIGGAKSFLGVSNEELAAIIEGIHSQNKRFIVAIDDLDRTDPEIIPRLLLALNDLLDLPGFTFLLPFDRDRVAKALAENHASYGTGHEFLDKIIDFSFLLPEPTMAHREKLFREQLSKLCDFIPSEVLDKFCPYLPSNPRKIKSLVRQLKVLESEVERHGADELNWQTLLFVTLIKTESLHFMRLFYEEALNTNAEFADDATVREIAELLEDGPSWDWYSLHKDDGQEARVQQLDTLLDRASDVETGNQEKRSRIKALVFAWFRNLSIYTLPQLSYTLNLLDTPHQITWKEFKESFDIWIRTQSPNDIDAWIIAHAAKRVSSAADVGKEYVESLIAYRNNLLESASSVRTIEQHEQYITTANTALELLNHLMTSGLPCVGESFFRTQYVLRKHLAVLEQWIHFDGNPADYTMRELEAKRLKEWVLLKFDNDAAVRALLEKTKHENSHFSDKKETKMQLLMQACLALIAPDEKDEVLALFLQPDAIIKLHNNSYEGIAREYLLNPETGLLSPPYRERLFAIFHQASTDFTVHRNCMEYFSLIARNRGGENENVPALIQDTEFLSALWSAAVSKQVQYRAIKEFQAERSKIIELGVDERILPMPDWKYSENKTAPN